MIRHAINLVASLALGATLAVGGVQLALSAVPAHGAPTVDSVFPRGLPHAPTEDECFARRCVWYAKSQGNGKGRSLILTRHRGEYLAKPISHRRARTLQAAWCKRPRVDCRY